MNNLVTAPDGEQIIRLLNAAGHADRFTLSCLAECSSSNDVLSALDDDGRIQVVSCHWQRSGRGRRGRPWLGEPGSSLALSSRWQLPASHPQLASFALVVAVSTLKSLRRLGLTGLSLKWPNDLLRDGSKCGGILLESSNRANGEVQIIVGIGLNLALSAATLEQLQATAVDYSVTNIQDDTVAPLSKERLIVAILDGLWHDTALFKAQGFAAFQADWWANFAYANAVVSISVNGNASVGECLGVNLDGALRVLTAEGELNVYVGDITLRPGGKK